MSNYTITAIKVMPRPSKVVNIPYEGKLIDACWVAIMGYATHTWVVINDEQGCQMCHVVHGQWQFTPMGYDAHRAGV